MLKKIVKFFESKPALPNKKELHKWISPSPFKTPSGNVTVYDMKKRSTVQTLDVPGGFRMLEYLMNKYPNENIHAKYLGDKTFQVRVGTKYSYTLSYDKPLRKL